MDDSFAVFADFPKFFRQMRPDVLNHENAKATKVTLLFTAKTPRAPSRSRRKVSAISRLNNSVTQNQGIRVEMLH
jgi:hypothetical protein